MKVCVGSFAASTGAHTQTVTGIVDASTGVTFVAKAVIFFGSGPTAEGFTSRIWGSVGFDDGTVHYAGSGCEPIWNFGEVDPLNTNSNSYSILAVARPFNIQTVIRTGKITSISDGSFDVRFDRNDIGDTIHFIAFGGDDIYTKVGAIQNGGPTPLKTTGVGFSPCALFFCERGSGGTAQNFVQKFGFASDAGEACINAISILPNAFSKTETRRCLKTDVCLLECTAVSPATSTILRSYSLQSLDADGFTLVQVDGAASNPGLWAYLAIGSVSTAFLDISQPASTGVVHYATGIPNKAGVFISTAHIASTAIENDLQWSVGITDGVNQQSLWFGEEKKAVTNDIATSYRSDNYLVTLATGNHTPSSSTIQAQASLDQFINTSAGTAGVDLNWTTVDATARQVVALILGDGNSSCQPVFPTVTPPATPPPSTIDIAYGPVAGFSTQWLLERFDTKTRLEDKA